jgi:hypothetical protein
MFNCEMLYARQIESVLAGVQQHPDLSSGRSGKNTRKHSSASHAGVVLFYSLIPDRAPSVESQGFVRLGSGRLPVQVRARCTRLNPKVHSRLSNASSIASANLFNDLPHPAMGAGPARRNLLNQGVDFSDAERRVKDLRMQILKVPSVQALFAFFIKANLLLAIAVWLNSQTTTTRRTQNRVDELSLVHGALPPSFLRIVA